MNLQEQSLRIDELRQEIALAEHEFREAQQNETTATTLYEMLYAKLFLRYRTEGKGIEESRQWAILGTQETRNSMRVFEGIRRASHAAMENKRKALGAIEALLYARNSEIKMEMRNG